MASENRRFETTLTAGENLNTSAFEYHAIALDDAKLGNNGREAAGILLNKPKSGEALTLGYFGEMKFAAGLGLSAGNKLTVATSGWFTKAASGDWVCGRCKSAVTSGSLGTGYFNFPTAFCATDSASAT